MQKKRAKKSTLAISLFYLMVSSVSAVYADGFYTIIGPDGRPMIVPMRAEKKEVESNKQKQEIVTEKTVQPTIDHSSTVKTIVMPIGQQKIEYAQAVEAQKNLPKAINTDEGAKPTIEQHKIEPMGSSDRMDRGTTKPLIVPVEQSKVSKAPTSSLRIEKPTVEKNTAVIEKAPLAQGTSDEAISSNGFSRVDGVDYVNNEYLENQEFNLDGKKRFYTIPDGTGRTETIERKKGVSRSVLDKLLNRSQQSAAPIVLSSTYVSLSSEDLKAAFENDRCFLEDYKKSIKTLTLNKDVGLWPRKPLKEKFEYELLKLDTSIQYMQIDSYSSNNSKPVYYWPLVVFLDEKGCIAEGVSGFKNSTTAATVLQHSAIQGVIKVPKDVRYVMMTPLASAVDVSEQELSNQGQIRISVLQ
ncbi:putative pilus assembly protein FilE [Acinetobacter sp. Ac_5812]|uniref:putative pilus assembly protein FilE n=1 Tax=Acinetobacter sp. Ac_5812 TaxID=1848937 RepID=UPI0014902C83|nr:putative pilus assembly protein FilE [Acinetobacter sp. Ac_5812]NNP68613.1 flagellar protein FilE [Acinetobacter sp. Ac_5812]